MLVTALRSRGAQSLCRIRHLQLRANTSESAAPSLLSQESGFPSASDASNSTAAFSCTAPDRRETTLDPVVQVQLRRMLRVDHAGEFAAGNCIGIMPSS